MTEERLDELWKQVVHIGKVENLDYDAMLALGSVFGELSSEVRKQAERAQELEQKNDRSKQEADFWRVEDREMLRLSHENKHYREVLEFYADEENYEFETIVSDCDIEVVSKVLDDYGQKARNALEREG